MTEHKDRYHFGYEPPSKSDKRSSLYDRPQTLDAQLDYIVDNMDSMDDATFRIYQSINGDDLGERIRSKKVKPK